MSSCARSWGIVGEHTGRTETRGRGQAFLPAPHVIAQRIGGGAFREARESVSWDVFL